MTLLYYSLIEYLIKFRIDIHEDQQLFVFNEEIDYRLADTGLEQQWTKQTLAQK